MRPAFVLLPSPAFGQNPSLNHRVEQLSVEKPITDPAVDRSCKPVLPPRVWLDSVSRVAALFALTPEGVG